MKKGLILLAMLTMIAFVGAAQDITKMEMPTSVINIPFAFYVDKMLLPAGTYEFTPNALGTHVQLRNVNGDEILLVPILSSVSLRQINHSEAVFDVLSQNHYLSEFYMKGMDGFTFNGVPEKHTHMSVVSLNE